MAKGNDQHWKEDEERFVNPYNFAPLRGEVKRGVPEKGSLTGKIECVLKAVTPLAFPDHEKQTSNEEEHCKYPFFSISDDVHIIPGSSLRGTVRSMFEAVTNSCLSVNNNNILSSRHSYPRTPAILVKENGKWHLYKADKRKREKNDQIKSNQVIRKWYDIKRSRQTEFIFTKKDEVECSDLESAVNDYKYCVELYRKNVEKCGGKPQDLFNSSTHQISETEMNAVFYEKVEQKNGEKKVYLSPSEISRSVFHNKLNDLLGSHKSCSLDQQHDTYCEACALFGIIKNDGNGNKGALASRVRFSDAHQITFKSAGYHTLKELASPKTTAVEFYTHRPDLARAWNYDYRTTDYKYNKMKHIKEPQRDCFDVQINGRKFYLHTLKSIYDTFEQTKRNSTMELADKGSIFGFTVYFDGVTQRQLERLVWTLTLGDNKEDSSSLYKVGHGKPIGLGSAKITVSSVKVRSFDSEKMQYRIDDLNVDDLISHSGINPNKAIRKLISLETTKGMDVSYPKAHDYSSNKPNASASHQWFVANRTGNGGTGTAWNINYTLPDITSNDISLPAYVKREDNKPYSSNGYSTGEHFSSGIMLKKRGERNGSNRRNK